MPDVEHFEHLIIGSGEAGKHVAWTFASEGHRTAVIERKLIGGSCPNIACLPSKNIIQSAKVKSYATRAAEFGLDLGTFATNMPGVQRRKRKMVEGEIQAHLRLYKESGAELIMGTARFVAPKKVQVSLNSGGTRIIEGERVFFNLGSRAAIPDHPGVAEAQPMTHIEALDLDRVPQHLVVLGGGYVGLELSQALRRFGAQVTLIEPGPQLVSKEDPDISAAIAELFRDEGIEVLLNTSVTRVEGRSGQQIRVHVKGPSRERVIEATDLLVATGRIPNTQSIGLDIAGVQLDPRGYIKVNERLETSAPNVWALGDCAGSPLFTHVALDDFRVVRDNLHGGNRTTTNRLIPYCIFTDPEMARVGLNETDAKSRGIEYRLVKLPMAMVFRANTLGETRGFMKMLIDRNSDQILGFASFGVEASEPMATVQTAMLAKVPYTVLRDGIFTHPTAAESLTYLLFEVPAKASQHAA
jgi:pyruvate/2-oxoglutarate dehydrogenase complex dihydrolipoamide dehydrogenase (E3) component